jgi:tetratricopeptide (TPR) repeat protein
VVETNPTDATAQLYLAAAHLQGGNPLRAVAPARAAARLAPADTYHLTALSSVLEAAGEFAEAESVLLGALGKEADWSSPALALADLYLTLGKTGDADTLTRKLVTAYPANPQSYDARARVLSQLGKHADAVVVQRTAVNRAEAVGSSAPNTLRNTLRTYERLAALAPNVGEIASGTLDPVDTDEGRLFVGLLMIEGRSAAVARMYELQLLHTPYTPGRRLPPGSVDRFSAACHAVRAATASDTPAPDQVVFRSQALAWFRADLSVRRATHADLPASAAAHRDYRLWQAHPSLAGVRDPAAAAGLSADERIAWAAFWAEVEAARSDARRRLLGK